MEYPLPNVAVPTIFQVELASGEQQGRMLSPGSSSWRIPAGRDDRIPEFWSDAQRAVLDGMRHLTRSGVHGLFLLSMVLAAGIGMAGRLLTLFTGAQLAVLLLWPDPGIPGGIVAEAGVATANLTVLGNLSLILGRKLKWNPVTQEIVGDDEAHRMMSRPQRYPYVL